MQAVIFDIDGTLLQSSEVDEAIYRESVTAVLGPVRFRDAPSDYEFVTDSGILLQVIDDNQIRADSALIAAVQQDFVHRLTVHIAAYGPFAEVDGARQLFASLMASDEYSLAVATGGWRASAELKMASAGFDIAGVPLASSDDAVDRPGIMRHALGLLDGEFSRVRYFGDGVWDREACERLGWQFEPVGPTVDGLDSFLEYAID